MERGTGRRRPEPRRKDNRIMAAKVKKKTRKAVAKRFKKSATGKVLHKKPGKRHLASSKTRKQKRRLRQTVQAGGSMAKSLSNEMGA